MDPEPQVQPQPASPQPEAAPQAVVQTPIMSVNSTRVHNALGRYDSLFDWVFRIGFATIFLSNTWTALVDPQGFVKLMEGNFLARMVGHFEVQVYIIAINDFLLGLLILSGFKRRLVYAWAGAWLIIVTFFKATSLL